MKKSVAVSTDFPVNPYVNNEITACDRTRETLNGEGSGVLFLLLILGSQ
jgi:hypothetical protein